MSLSYFHTLVVGSGAAGLAAACRLREYGVREVAILTEGLHCGTSFNAGSDKQTYYKLGLCGNTPDSPYLLAQSLFEGGSVDGDMALVEASCSVRAFLRLVELGVPFPRDRYGAFPGYRTDHDLAGRATSSGPYTSQAVCRAWISEVRRLEIPILEGRRVASIIHSRGRALGVLAWNEKFHSLEPIRAENIIFAVGGPGAMYQASVYPTLQRGGIGTALQAGALAQSLPEAQFGLASTKFRWNVSGSYMQAIPRLISRAADRDDDEEEFLLHCSAGLSQNELYSLIFLKGYQWPFDVRKIQNGSSQIDQWVYEETQIRGRRVFLDYRSNPTGLLLEKLHSEAFDYLTRSQALASTPIERLRCLNPAAISLYKDHGIDLENEPLQIAVSFQHSNGGLGSNIWWESPSLSHFFPIGEANGSHGVYRPGGSALNSGQVGALRSAEYIGKRYSTENTTESEFEKALQPEWERWNSFTLRPEGDWQMQRAMIQKRMSFAGAHIREVNFLKQAIPEAWAQVERIQQAGGQLESIVNWDLALTHAVYLEAQLFQALSGTGSRGSALVLENGKIIPEDTAFRQQILVTRYQAPTSEMGRVENYWRAVRPLVQEESWFETAWSQFTSGTLYD